jgi:hypothetical protein
VTRRFSVGVPRREETAQAQAQIAGVACVTQRSLLDSDWPDIPLARRKRESMADLYVRQCQSFGLPPLVRELQFAKHLGRKWRFDCAFPDYKIAVEVNGVAVRRLAGQLVVMGRHASITGIRNDNEKLNCAALLGWHVLRFLQTDIKPQHALRMTQYVLSARGWKPT